MTFVKHARVSFGGKLEQLSGSAEIWNCSMNLYTGIPAGEWLAGPQAYADGIAAPLLAWFNLAANGMASTATLEYVKVNNITAAGLYADPVTHVHNFSPVGRGALASSAPSFCSVAMTWETAAARGYAHRGRIYPPNYSYIPQGSQINDADALAVATAGGKLRSLLLAKLDGTTLVLPVNVSKVGAGAIGIITGCTADNIYDVQRRRKNRVQGTRSILK